MSYSGTRFVTPHNATLCMCWVSCSLTTSFKAAFLSVIFLTALGMILYDNGEVIREAHKNDFDDDVPKWFNLEFAGAFIATLFWVRYMCVQKHVVYSIYRAICQFNLTALQY